MIDPIPGRRGWEFGEAVRESAAVSRISVYHAETGTGFWVWGKDRGAWLEAALAGIDALYADKVAQYADLIAEGDLRGPNVKVLVE